MFRRKHFAPEGEVTGSGGGAPAPAAPAPVPAVPATEQEPHWLAARLERERSSAEKNARAALLKEIGVSDPAAAAKLVADETARQAASRTLEQRALEAEQARDAEKARVAALSGTLGTLAAERMAGLTEAQRAFVVSVAKDDPAKQIETIIAATPTWSAPAPAVSVAPAAAPVTPPATTAPGQTAPSGTAPTSQPDHKAEYKRLKAENPVQAAAYLTKHESQIYPRA